MLPLSDHVCLILTSDNDIHGIIPFHQCRTLTCGITRVARDSLTPGAQSRPLHGARPRYCQRIEAPDKHGCAVGWRYIQY